MASKHTFFIALFLPGVLAALNLLSSHSNGDIFSFSSNPHVQYLSDLQVAHTLSIERSSAASISTENEDTGFAELPLSPSTCLRFSGSESITPESFRQRFKLYEKRDDVWNENYLENLFILYEGNSSNPTTPIELHPETYGYLNLIGISRIFLSSSIHPPSSSSSEDTGSIPTYRITALKNTIPSGPFVFSQAKGGSKRIEIHGVFRLYLDKYDAFLFGAIPNLLKGGYILTNITSSTPPSSPETEDGEETQLIPVPSRLASLFPTTSSKAGNRSSPPLAGLRFALKDIFDAQGLPTAAGSHAYAQTHPIPSIISPSLAPLLRSGITIIGKTRTSQFAHGAHPWEFVDFPYSYNPRGDGYMTAAASSSGSAVAVAGYAWLDGSVGSDTRGSVRRPAALVGVYGIRPTHGTLDLKKGVVPLSEEMDTAGFFVRDPSLFVEVANRWYGLNPPLPSSSTTTTAIKDLGLKLLYPTDHFPLTSSPAAQRLIDNFMSSLSTHLDINPIHTNFTRVLTPYFNTNGSFTEFQQTANVLAEYRSWVDVGEPTTRIYKRKYGREPVFDPVPQRLFQKAKKGVTKSMFKQAVKTRREFQHNMETLFKNNDGECNRSTLFVYHTGTGGRPSYRVEELNHIQGSVSFSMNVVEGGGPPKAAEFFHLLASMGGMPEITIPLGEVEYWSQISRRWEPIPVSVQVVAGRGCDSVLVGLVRALSEGRVPGVGGVLRGVGVGRSVGF